jgi:hypothetical protein
LDLHFDPQFLPQFAVEAFLEGLVWFPFAAGKLPEPAEVPARGPLGEQEQSVTED